MIYPVDSVIQPLNNRGLVFRKLLRAAENRRSSLPDRLCYPTDFNHSHQITQSENMMIVATRWNGIGNCIFRSLSPRAKFAALWCWRATSLEITVRKLLCSVVIQAFFYMTCTSTGSQSDQFCQVSISNRLWPVIHSVQLQNVLHFIVPTLFNLKLEKYIAPVRICWNICVCHGVQ